MRGGIAIHLSKTSSSSGHVFEPLATDELHQSGPFYVILDTLYNFWWVHTVLICSKCAIGRGSKKVRQQLIFAAESLSCTTKALQEWTFLMFFGEQNTGS